MDILVERFRDRAAFGMLDLDFGTVASAKVRAAAQGQEVAAALRAIRQVPKDRRWDLGSGPVPLGDGSVTVLHPSEERLRQLIRMSSVGPNRFSSAVLIDWGERSVLLGADLERPEWVSLVEAPRLSLGNPIKVPHHGSPGAFDKTWVGDTATTPENASRRSLVAPFDKHPKLPDLDDDESIPGLLGEFTQVDLTSLPFKTTPTATGQWKLQDLRDARDAGIEENPPLPGGFRPLTSAQVEPNEDDAWVLAELSADGACDVRGGAASLNLTA
jgi:hypothetical protein